MKIDYKNKKFNNPFFQKKRRSSLIKKSPIIGNWRVRIYTLVAVAIFILTGWLLFCSSIFSIQKIVVEGAVRTHPDEIAEIGREQVGEKKFWIFSQNNIFLFDVKQLKESLTKLYSFQETGVAKNRPGTIVIKVLEKSQSYIWRENDKYYCADIDGYIIEEINPLDIKEANYPLISNGAESKITDNKINLNPTEVAFIVEIFSYFQKGNSYGIEAEVFILGGEKGITLKIINGPEIYLNSKETADFQFLKLMDIKDKKLKDDFYSRTYIDLRFGDKVYYR